VLRFKSYGALVSERWPTRLDTRMPFFYLRTQGFWQAFTLEMTAAQSIESCFVCELNEELFYLLADADFRLKARLLLVSRYFEPRERVALLVSLGLCVDGADRNEPRIPRRTVIGQMLPANCIASSATRSTVGFFAALSLIPSQTLQKSNGFYKAI